MQWSVFINLRKINICWYQIPQDIMIWRGMQRADLEDLLHFIYFWTYLDVIVPDNIMFIISESLRHVTAKELFSSQPSEAVRNGLKGRMTKGVFLQVDEDRTSAGGYTDDED